MPHDFLLYGVDHALAKYSEFGARHDLLALPLRVNRFFRERIEHRIAVAQRNRIFVLRARGAHVHALDGEKRGVADGAYAHGAFLGAVEITLPVRRALRECAPGIVFQQELTFNLLRHASPHQRYAAGVGLFRTSF
jgi:hypothetical protein